MNKNLLLKELLKSKFDKNKSAEEIIDEFIKQTSTLASKELEEQLANLLIFISQNIDTDKESLKELVNSKISALGISINPLNLEETYSWMSFEVIVHFYHSQKLALATCGFFAWKGADWINLLVDKIIDAKLKKPRDEFGYRCGN